ncbi:transporter substrate-binding domain-containing protein [Pseudidiomarina sp. 1APP75-32.1]|uniref:Transporter substrate-binding domain-containing protein n=1 Tax=Pseudidiomarina terrestris TaxID=2820060 RepID=A0AAW7QZ62_9GAMM|nr:MULTISPECIES: transporter substrate-binding domain-containing protein [unclassified Pseudidiomarina]MDN7124722.1 transporter substrate-binding domain-containing protein [Pseudidiomarina sp. 1APP75-32.1]MDN7129804.1 transporter substrate-binding domain-containing protein [Pseudidiomarina sp. 1APR75-15]
MKIQLRKLLVLTLLLFSPFTLAQTAAPEQAGVTTGEITVAVRVSPPFVMKDANGDYHGLTIELWEHIAEVNNYNFSYRETGLEQLIDGVANGDFAVGLGAISVTAERERRIDFTLPFYNAGLGIAVPAAAEPGWWTVTKRFFSFEFLTVMAALTLILLGAGVLVWLAERRHNPEEFSDSKVKGLGAGFWWAAVTMTTVGYGDKSPRTLMGRGVALIWMFTSVIIISSFTASITSALTVNKLSTRVQGKDDLANVRVASVPASYSAYWLDRENIGYQHYSDLTTALENVQAGKADAVVYDAPLLKYQLRKDFSGLTVLKDVFAPQDYALVLPPQASEREVINRTLLRYIRSSEWRQSIQRYLGDDL